MTPAMTWWGKCAAMKTLERQTHTWTAQKPVHSRAFRYLPEGRRKRVQILHVQGTCSVCFF